MAVVDTDRHAVIEAPHPGARGKAQIEFRESRTFGKVDDCLREMKEESIDWTID